MKQPTAILAAALILTTTAAFSITAQKGVKHPAEKLKNAFSYAADVKTKIKFINGSSQVRKVFWLNYAGKRKLYKVLKGGDFYTQETFLTHPWLVTDSNENAQVVYYPDSVPRTIWLR